MSELGLDTANRSHGFEPIPAGTSVELVMKIKPGNVGIDGLCKRSSKGDSEGLDVEYVVKGGEHDRRKLYGFHLLDGTTAGHAKAGEITRSLLRAIFEAVHAIDPNDNSSEAISRRASASLADFNGATFVAELGIERGGQKPDGGAYPDKNIIGKVLRVGDKNYRKLDQPSAAPIERSTPPTATASTANGSPAVALTAIPKPGWARDHGQA
jgi:hypothetical protein